MSLQGKAIKQKIKSVGSIKKIAKTMEMVSVSKMKRAIEETLTSRPYFTLAFELLENLLQDTELSHPYLKEGEDAREVVLIIAGNKGLCGGYHANLFKLLSGHLSGMDRANLEAVTVGKYAEKMARNLGIKIKASFIHFNEKTVPDETRPLAKILMEEFDAGAKKVWSAYTKFSKATSYAPQVEKLLPVERVEPADAEMQKRDFSKYLLEPSSGRLLQVVLPHVVEVSVYQMIMESLASEHSARMFAMKNAGDNAGDLLEDLTLSYNQARQSAITQELAEIVGGAEALSMD